MLGDLRPLSVFDLYCPSFCFHDCHERWVVASFSVLSDSFLPANANGSRVRGPNNKTGRRALAPAASPVAMQMPMQMQTHPDRLESKLLMNPFHAYHHGQKEMSNSRHQDLSPQDLPPSILPPTRPVRRDRPVASGWSAEGAPYSSCDALQYAVHAFQYTTVIFTNHLAGTPPLPPAMFEATVLSDPSFLAGCCLKQALPRDGLPPWCASGPCYYWIRPQSFCINCPPSGPGGGGWEARSEGTHSTTFRPGGDQLSNV